MDFAFIIGWAGRQSEEETTEKYHIFSGSSLQDLFSEGSEICKSLNLKRAISEISQKQVGIKTSPL